MNHTAAQLGLLSTGIAGLDDVLGGGLPEKRLYLVQGDPGAGKTTLALQFLLEGAKQGERVLYVTLSESRVELEAVARSHGWSLDEIDLYELSAVEEFLNAESIQTVYRSAEVELHETSEQLLRHIEAVKPTRTVFDSLSELRLLARDPLRYRRLILSLKQYFSGTDCTVVLLDDQTADDMDLQLQSIAHGVICLEQVPPTYGGDRRRIRVQKLRGARFRSGYHDFVLQTGGLQVFPRLVAAEHRHYESLETMSSAIENLDTLLGGGGLDRGVSALLIGPAGAGKSTVAVQFAVAAAERGEHVAFYTFEESLRTLFARSEALDQRVEEFIEAGLITIRQVDPAELSPGEFSHLVRLEVEERHTRLIVVDSLNGYLNAMPEERHLILQLHELLAYLSQNGITTILTMAQHGMIGSMATPIDISYLADTVMLFRFYEWAGEIKQALSVIKRRGGAHERSIRPLCLSTDNGIQIGPPLADFHGVLTGVPSMNNAHLESAAR